MAERQVGTSVRSETDENVTEEELDRSTAVEQCESDSSDHELQITNEILQYVLSKDRSIYWMFHPFSVENEESAPASKNFIPGPTGYSISRITDIKSAFRLFMDPSIIEVIVLNTNIEGRKIYGKEWTDLNEERLEAYIGLLLLGGIFRAHGEPMKKLWNAETGRHIFRATMSMKVFLQISRVLRFDSGDQPEGKEGDELAPIRDIWDKWVEILPRFYNPGNNVTVGEQIVGFRGICPIKQFTSSRRTSGYGIKVWTLCDSKSSYALRAQICTGKLSEEASGREEGMHVVSRLTQGLKYRNITCDNFFTSYKLGQLLLKRKLTLLGSIRSCRSELPVVDANKELHSSDFYFTKDTTLLHYVPKKNKPVFLLSTMHKQGELTGRDDKKPLMIMEYESTKGAVDRLDREIETYSCKRKTKLWATTLFYHIIDTSAYNAFILWTGINPTWRRNKLYKRRMFLEELGKSLVLPYMATRKNFPRTEEAMSILKNVQDKSVASGSCSVPKRTGGLKRARCKFCPKKCDNKTSIKCASCDKYLCKTHTVYLCLECKK